MLLKERFLILKLELKKITLIQETMRTIYAVFDFSEFDETKVQTLSTRSFTGLRGIDFEFHDGYGKVKKVSEIKNVYVDDYKDSDPDYDASDYIFLQKREDPLLFQR